MAFVLLEEYAGLSREAIFLDPDAGIEPSSALFDALEQLYTHRPLQYVLGHAEFCGLVFAVNEDVLIPRPETEELVEWISREWKGRPVRILDIGTGSGAIAVALAKKLTEAMVSAVDISEKAILMAAANAAGNAVQVSFAVCDILNGKPEGKFDVIVSNPPYVRHSEQEFMRKNVLDYEPGNALFVPDDDPLLFYRRIAGLGREMLNEGGALYFEINEAFGNETVRLLTELGYSQIEIRADILGKERMVKGIVHPNV